MSDSEILYDSDQDISKHHSKLIESVIQLDDRQRVKKPERSEPTLEVSEYHLVKSGITNKNVVHVQDLAKCLGQKAYQSDIIRKFWSIKKKTKVLPKPLEKPAANRIRRIVGFENTKKELGKWNAIISKNRTAEQVFFPLCTPAETATVKIAPTTEFLKRFRLQSDLQKKLEELDPTPKVLPTKEEEKYQMTMEEVIMKRKEAARIRAQQSYKEAKAYRQRRIKSKKFHRIQRKENIKQQLKKFEILQKTNPEEALARLEQLDKSRAEERMSLRHKNTGQWAKNKQIRAKYDRETRQALAEQLSISKELTQGVKRSDDSDNENEENQAPLVLSNNNKENPWVNNGKSESEIDEFIKSYRKYWEQKNQGLQERVVEDRPTHNSLGNTSEKSNFDKSSKSDDVINPTITSTNQITEELVENRKLTNDEKYANCVTLDGNELKKQEIQLCSKKNKTKSKAPCNIGSTSIWHIEELLSNVEMNAKTFRSQDINEVFDSVEEKLKQRAELKLQEVKRKLKIDSKIKKFKNKESEDAEDYSSKLEFKDSKQRPILDHPLEETITNKISQRGEHLTNLNIVADIEQTSTNISASREMEIDPQKYLSVKPKYLKTQLPDMYTDEHVVDSCEQEEETHRIMSEAFADDNVIQEFRKEKEEEVKKSQLEDIDQNLPGWGSWAGKNIQKNHLTRKKRRFILKYPKDIPRKDENKGDVIIFEENNQKLKEHLVGELPYPFTAVKDFEASIRAPLGRTFIPENAHSRLIQPTVNTKLGQVIKPMAEDVLVKKHTALKRRIVNKKKDGVRGNKSNRK